MNCREMTFATHKSVLKKNMREKKATQGPVEKIFKLFLPQVSFFPKKRVLICYFFCVGFKDLWNPFYLTINPKEIWDKKDLGDL